MRESTRAALLTIAVLGSAGCGSAEHAAIKTASDAFGCSEDNIQVTDLDDDRYRVAGCGQHNLYQCDEDECWAQGYLADKARTRASREFNCSPDKITVRWVQHETYRVEACDSAATYSCSQDGCIPEGSEKPHPAPFFMPPAPMR